MRIGFISDVHANLVALDAALAELDRRGVDRIVCLGDVVDLGPRPQEVVDRLRERGITTVRGNHDPLDEVSPVPQLQAIADWHEALLTEDALEWLRTCPSELVIEACGQRVWCVHGSPARDTEQILAETPAAQLRQWTAHRPADVLVCGHTHLQLLRRVDHLLVLNVGSVGMPFLRPFDGDEPVVLPVVDFGLLDVRPKGVRAELLRLPLDTEAYLRAVHASGMPDAAWWARHWL